MKQILFAAAIAAYSAAAAAQGDSVTIQGTAPAGTTAVYWFADDKGRNVDSVAVENGNFSLKLEKGAASFATFVIGRGNTFAVAVDGAPTKVDLAGKKVEGSALNGKFADIQGRLSAYTTQQMEIYAGVQAVAQDSSQAAKAAVEKAMARIDSLEKAEMAELMAFCKSNNDNILPAYYLGLYYYMFGYDDLKELLSPSSAAYALPMAEAVKKHMAALAKRQPGADFTDLEMADMQGNPVKLSQWVGKGGYVLVDFWASWCGPCRAEMPNVVANYEKYKGKGFNVVGVSFDNNAEAWKKSVADLGMEWPQMSDLKGWACAAHEAYGVNSIPSSVLVGPDGKIVAADLRAEALGSKLKEIYGF